MEVALGTLMKVGIPQWRDRVSPVLDVASSLLVVDLAKGRELRREQRALTAGDPIQRARQVSQLGTDVLICGAVSWPLEIALSAAGVRVIPFTCGMVEEVLSAFVNGKLTRSAFLMPGCCGRRRRLRARRGRPR
jgi:predicted Fe-Mo cluster-binding NifX family protein